MSFLVVKFWGYALLKPVANGPTGVYIVSNSNVKCSYLRDYAFAHSFSQFWNSYRFLMWIIMYNMWYRIVLIRKRLWNFLFSLIRFKKKFFRTLLKFVVYSSVSRTCECQPFWSKGPSGEKKCVGFTFRPALESQVVRLRWWINFQPLCFERGHYLKFVLKLCRSHKSLVSSFYFGKFIFLKN